MSRKVQAVAVPEGGFRRIAVLRLSSLGDVVLTLPVVHALRAAYPTAELDYWVKEEFADLVAHDPAITHVRELERDARKVEDLVSMSAELEKHDLIVDLHASSRTRLLTFRQRGVVLRTDSRRLQRARWIHARWTHPQPLPHVTERYAATLAPIGVPVNQAPRVSVRPVTEAWAQAERDSLAPAGVCVALAPGAAHETKRWPEERWCALEAALAGLGVGRMIIGTAAERRALPRLDAQVSASGGAKWYTESIERAAALLGVCTVAVTHDSGLMHLAAARGRPVVALFGSTSPVLGFRPVGEHHTVICRELACQPCTLHGRKACPLGHFRCMTTIEPAEVLAAVQARLSSAVQG
ncbi:MAG: glycosyltransferase family 9 protein [Candidatus Eisenbacteria bacterium]|nr:glycosyltransferase family 9 protein [Candidatus Eisenbacteria bacterium]